MGRSRSLPPKKPAQARGTRCRVKAGDQCILYYIYADIIPTCLRLKLAARFRVETDMTNKVQFSISSTLSITTLIEVRVYKRG